MGESKKPVAVMVLLGIVRHLLVVAGMWMQARGWIDAATQKKLTGDDTVLQIVGWLLVVAPIAWSVMQKWQVWEWLKTKAHVNNAPALAASATPSTPQQIIEAAPGPNVPI